MLHNNELISIEEILVKPQNNNHEQSIRQFILFNRQTDLKICIYTLGARIMSCMLDQQEIVCGGGDHNNDDAMLVNWDSHVYGSDTICLLLNVAEYDNYQIPGLLSSICVGHVPRNTYLLTKNDEFIIEGDDFPLTDILFNPFFFNLNSVANSPGLDGHKLHVRTSHESITVMSDSTGCQYVDRAGPAPLSDRLDGCELVYSSENHVSSTAIPITDSYIIATLRYKNRFVESSLQIEPDTKTSMKILIKKGAIAFVPYGMNKFKLRYRFHW